MPPPMLTKLIAGHVRGRRCPGCKGNESRVLQRKRIVVDSVHECSRCGLYFRATGLQGTRVAHWYYSRLYLGDGGMATAPRVLPIPELLEWVRASGKDRSELVGRVLASLKQPPPWICVIGASWGYEVLSLRSLGIPTWGVELGDDRREFGVNNYDLKLFRTVADGLTEFGPGGVFVSSHVVEHIPGLQEFVWGLRSDSAPVAQIHITPRVEPMNASTARTIGREHPIGVTCRFWRTLASSTGDAVELAHHRPAGASAASELVCVLFRPEARLNQSSFEWTSSSEPLPPGPEK